MPKPCAYNPNLYSVFKDVIPNVEWWFWGHEQSVLGNNFPIYTLCGNHDMYSGGGGYYWLLDQIGQKASYFCLRNDNWMFLAMDTGFHDNNPFNVATNMTQPVSEDGWSEADWHMQQIKNAGNRKLVLLSHHHLLPLLRQCEPVA